MYGRLVPNVGLIGRQFFKRNGLVVYLIVLDVNVICDLRYLVDIKSGQTTPALRSRMFRLTDEPNLLRLERREVATGSLERPFIRCLSR